MSYYDLLYDLYNYMLIVKFLNFMSDHVVLSYELLSFKEKHVLPYQLATPLYFCNTHYWKITQPLPLLRMAMAGLQGWGKQGNLVKREVSGYLLVNVCSQTSAVILLSWEFFPVNLQAMLDVATGLRTFLCKCPRYAPIL